MSVLKLLSTHLSGLTALWIEGTNAFSIHCAFHDCTLEIIVDIMTHAYRIESKQCGIKFSHML